MFTFDTILHLVILKAYKAIKYLSFNCFTICSPGNKCTGRGTSLKVGPALKKKLKERLIKRISRISSTFEIRRGLISKPKDGWYGRTNISELIWPFYCENYWNMLYCCSLTKRTYVIFHRIPTNIFCLEYLIALSTS